MACTDEPNLPLYGSPPANLDAAAPDAADADPGTPGTLYGAPPAPADSGAAAPLYGAAPP